MDPRADARPRSGLGSSPVRGHGRPRGLDATCDKVGAKPTRLERPSAQSAEALPIAPEVRAGSGSVHARAGRARPFSSIRLEEARVTDDSPVSTVRRMVEKSRMVLQLKYSYAFASVAALGGVAACSSSVRRRLYPKARTAIAPPIAARTPTTVRSSPPRGPSTAFRSIALATARYSMVTYSRCCWRCEATRSTCRSTTSATIPNKIRSLDAKKRLASQGAGFSHVFGLKAARNTQGLMAMRGMPVASSKPRDTLKAWSACAEAPRDKLSMALIVSSRPVRASSA